MSKPEKTKPIPLALWHGPKQSAVLCPKDAYAWHLQVAGTADIRRDCRPVSIVLSAVKARNLAASHCQECQQPGRLSAK